MSTWIACPACSASYDVASDRVPARGVSIRCPSCGERFAFGRDDLRTGPRPAGVGNRGLPIARRVLVTGASRGVGRAIARAFAQQGDTIAIHHRDSADLAESLRAELGGDPHVVVRADLAKPDEVAAMVDAAATALGGIDVLVNNAGQAFGHSIVDASYEEWQAAWNKTLAVNLTGAANVTFCAVKHMLARPKDAPSGRIINVGSRGAYRGEPDAPAYGAAKAALHAFGQSIAVALAPHGIAVTSVAPGFVLEDATNAAYKVPRGPVHSAQSPFGRVARPEEIASAVVWLASHDAEWASGAVLDFNGASYLR